MALQSDISTLSTPVSSIPLSTRMVSFLATAGAMLTTENPLIWSYTRGAAHPLADMSGPYYIYGAPNVNFAPGKAVLGATEDLKSEYNIMWLRRSPHQTDSAPIIYTASPLFLFSGKVLGPNGEPVEATLDLWQANTRGEYRLSEYRNRGKITVDLSTGSFEILTIPPAIYAILGAQRVAHIHGIITAPGYQSLITQIYLCPKNEPTGFQVDFLTMMRGNRENMIKGWSIPTEKGDRYWDWPQLESSETETVKLVEEWNSRLASQPDGWKITCGASQVITLNKA
ncbi:Dioxygenase [Rhizoctonia solani]|uniref:Dioxygenase n=1 Tax=Rhizoctonia solani TaxID=456999 RepID=A0A8H7LLZ5_9AGAM|nr:Dioxygenase [Rhizoctonia solani]